MPYEALADAAPTTAGQEATSRVAATTRARVARRNRPPIKGIRIRVTFILLQKYAKKIALTA